MQRDQEAFLWDVLRAIEAIGVFCHGLDLDAYLSNDLVQAAVERKLEIVGEALRQGEAIYPGMISELVDARAAINMRNRLAHGYLMVMQEIVWSTIQDDLPRLRASIVEKLGTLLPTPPTKPEETR